jgi:cytochrome c-type biogenesis protein CcmH/NrfG
MRAAIALILLALTSQPLLAADTPAPEAVALPTLDEVRAALDAKDFPAAQRLLAQLAVDQPKNADVWNLLGFTNRNMNLAGPALEAYEMALKLDPKHLGALEYQGELFVTLKRLDDANKNLDRLKTLCKDCEELQDLQAAIKAAPAE